MFKQEKLEGRLVSLCELELYMVNMDWFGPMNGLSRITSRSGRLYHIELLEIF